MACKFVIGIVNNELGKRFQCLWVVLCQIVRFTEPVMGFSAIFALRVLLNKLFKLLNRSAVFCRLKLLKCLIEFICSQLLRVWSCVYLTGCCSDRSGWLRSVVVGSIMLRPWAVMRLVTVGQQCLVAAAEKDA